VRLAVERLNLPHEMSGFGRVSISLGVASAAPRPGDPATSLIDLADRALYRAKQGGRNQVQVAGNSVPGRVGPASRQEPELQSQPT
jgi:diguanylate cyclase (GGDEF)-like protein